MFLIRRLALAIVIVWLREPVSQIVLLIVIQFSAFLYLVIIRPFAERQDNILNIINETCIFIVSVVFITLRKDAGLSDEEVERRTQAVIYLLSAAGVLATGIIIFYVTRQIIKFIKEYRNKRKQRLEATKGERKEKYLVKKEEKRKKKSAKKKQKLAVYKPAHGDKGTDHGSTGNENGV